MSITIRHLRGRHAVRDAGAAYDELCSALTVHVNGRRPWLQAWSDCYDDWTPWVVLATDGAGTLRAAAPLATRQRGPLTSVVGLGNGPTDSLSLPALDEEAADALVGGVADALPRTWQMSLDQVDPDDRVVRGLLDRLDGRLEPGEGMPAVRFVDRDRSAHLSKNTRKALNRFHRRAADEGLEVETAWTTDPRRIREALPEVAAVHRARDAELGRRGDHTDPRAAAFYVRAIEDHADLGEVDLLTVRLGGRLAAYGVELIDGRSLRCWDNRVSPEFTRFSAGRVANTEAVRHAAADPRYDELDWMQGEEPFKLSRATHVVPRSVLHASSGGLVKGAHGLLGRARELKRSSPALTRAWVALHSGRDFSARKRVTRS